MKRRKYGLKLFVAVLFAVLGLCAYLQGVYAQDNPNTVTFDNQSGEDALVKLIGPTGQVVEVPNGVSRTVNAAAGEYYILARYGSEPDKYKYTKGDPFAVKQTATQYSTITITLHKVIDGNYPSHPISSDEFDKALEVNLKDAESYFNRGIDYADKGEFDRAISDCNRAIEINPRYAAAYLNRGNAYAGKGEFDRAISDFNRALEINPRFAEVYNNRALVYYSKKEYDKTWEDVHKAQELGGQVHPGFLDALRKASGRQR